MEGAPGGGDRVAVAVQHHDVSRVAEERHLLRRAAEGGPGGAVAGGELAGVVGRHGERDVAAERGQAIGALERAGDMPQRRVRPLHGLHDQRDVLEGEVLAGMVEPVGTQPLENDFQALVETLLGGAGFYAEELRLVRRGAAADAELEPAAAHDVEHADLFQQPQRMIEAERIGERPEAKGGRALRDGGEKQARRGRGAQRRAVMLGHVIGVEAGPFVELDQSQAVFILAPQIGARSVEVIEDGELHYSRFMTEGCLAILHTTLRKVACQSAHSSRS